MLVGHYGFVCFFIHVTSLSKVACIWHFGLIFLLLPSSWIVSIRLPLPLPFLNNSSLKFSDVAKQGRQLWCPVENDIVARSEGMSQPKGWKWCLQGESGHKQSGAGVPTESSPVEEIKTWSRWEGGHKDRLTLKGYLSTSGVGRGFTQGAGRQGVSEPSEWRRLSPSAMPNISLQHSHRVRRISMGPMVRSVRA